MFVSTDGKESQEVPGGVSRSRERPHSRHCPCMFACEILDQQDASTHIRAHTHTHTHSLLLIGISKPEVAKVGFQASAALLGVQCTSYWVLLDEHLILRGYLGSRW